MFKDDIFILLRLEKNRKSQASYKTPFQRVRALQEDKD